MINRGFKVPLIIIAFILSLGIASLMDIYKSTESYKDNLIRLHIIANSDSQADQNLKIKIRDKVINEMSKKFEISNSIDESRQLIKNNLDEIEYIAEEEIRNSGLDYDVNVYYGNYSFPTKAYGSITLPAGEYEAVRVVIGEGKGKNWWCVMFPPLCFIDITHGLTDERTKNELKKVLTEEEYDVLVNADSDKQVPIKLKFKVVELIEMGKMRLAELFVSEK
jgi:stage II sporulation protein R